jgi:hypothetical protein
MLTAPPSPLDKSEKVVMVDRVRVTLFPPVIVTAPPLPANSEEVLMVESVKDAASEAAIVTAPP